MDTNVFIDKTTILLKDILNSLFDVENISNGFGHGSIVYKLSIHFASQNDPSTKPETLSFALKIPSSEIFYQQKLKIDLNLPKNAKEIISKNVAKIHQNECHFYTKISTFLNKLKIPKVYETKEWNILENEKGYILIEDLSEDGYVLSKHDFILENRIEAVIKEIAKMQAEWIKTSLNVDWKEVKNKTNEEMWEKITNDFLSFILAFIKLVDDKEKVMNDMNKIMFLVGNKNYHFWAYQNVHKELGLPNVLVHGDLWNSNIFFKNSSDNEILPLVDWQLVYEESLAADLVRYIVRSTEAPVRRKIEPTIFSFYIKCIRDLIRNLEINESQIQKAYIYSFISEFIELLMITVNNTKSLQDLINDDENVAVNLNLKEKIIYRAISAMEDIAKFIEDNEMAAVVHRFQKTKA